MVAWIMRRVKLLFGLMAISPLLLLGFSLYDTYSIYPAKKELFNTGTEVAADIEGGTRTKRRRSGTSFSVNLAWKDKAGKARTAEKVSISKSLADRIIQNDVLTVDTLKIKYMEGDDTVAPFVLADNPATGPSPPAGLEMAGFALPIGLLGAAGFYFLRRREKRALA
jgi:LPXTG-motif cell wall-anchored protein